MSNPDQIRAEIEATRADLSDNVNQLGDKVSPSQIAKRQTARLRGGAMTVKNHIMGASDSARSSASDALSQAGDMVSEAPGRIASQTKGSPMAAGLIAFGAGMLLSALFPASRKEAQAAAALKEQAQPLVEQATNAAKEVAGNLQEPAQDALESVKSTASDAMDTVKSEGQSAVGDVKDKAMDAKDTVQEHAGNN